MYNNPINAYAEVSNTTMSGREIEAKVLTKAALKLKKCQENWNSENHRTELEEALNFNQKIWSIFQGELTKPDHLMDKELRQNLLNLSIFVDKRTLNIRAFPDPEKLTAIININKGLAASLRKSPATLENNDHKIKYNTVSHTAVL